MTTKYDIHLDGVKASDLSMAVLRDLADLIVEGATRSARLAAEGRSTARGTAPAWLADAADVRLRAIRDGSAEFDMAARPLSEAAPDIFSQQTLFGSRAGDATAVDLLMDAVDDAVAGKRDSDRLDAGVLQVLVNTKWLFGRGTTKLRISRPGRAIEFDVTAVRSFQTLADELPAPRIDRVQGKLDSLTDSTKTFVLRMTDGSPLRGGLSGSLTIEAVKAFFGTPVVVEGMVSFHASGRPLRIEADHLAAATDRDAIWSRPPRSGSSLAVSSGDLKSLVGQWPSDESDEELLAGLKELA